MSAITRLETFARAGYLARALTYFMIGYLTIRTGVSEGTSTVLEDIRDLPMGRALAVLTGIGLFGYGVFRLYGAAIDIDGDGRDAKGVAKRIGQAASGLAHLILAFLAVTVGLGEGAPSGGGGDAAAETAMTLPGGVLLMSIVGIGFVIAGFEQAVKAATAKFMAQLDARVPPWAEPLGRIGYAARSVVFVVIGWRVLATAWGEDHELSFEAAIDATRQVPMLFTAVAFGLLVFGLFSLMMARYARIRNEDVLARLRSRAGRLRR